MPGYELRALIGVGQLGEVHRAYQPSVGREVAVRIFGPGMVGHPQFVRRFETASQRITRVEHPHVVPLARLLAGARPGGDGEPADDAAGISASASRATALTRRARSPCSRQLRRAWRRLIATAWCTGASGPRTCCSTGRTTPTSPISAWTRSVPGSITFATNGYDAPERLGWRSRHARGRCVLTRRPGPSPARRLAATAGRAVPVGGRTGRPVSWAGRRIPIRAVATSRSTS